MRAIGRVLSVLVAAGCGSGAGGETDEVDGTDTDALADTDDTDGGVDTDVDWSSLNGTVPAEALPAPEFAATNRDGTPRDRDDLLGHPTVMWFYPAAASSG